ncbi:MAG: 2-oxoglutarate dehydrogenase complex dihydrolipoyllysine-residue succinyltransferase [Hyphomicrobiales bacterium]|nr:2-oxoglutarate dehydrogenase complex dihydrolipoyllysine-residue succinyltransferase [Hyphomicrobiales bacterium]
MKTPIKVPTLSESISEVTVIQWFKKPGDAVKADDPDDPVLELETDKANMEVTAPVSGVLSEIVAKADSSVNADAILGYIDESGAAAAPAKTKPAEKDAPAAPKSPPPSPAPVPPPAADESRPPSPAAGKLARENQIDPATIAGTGKDGRVTKGDVLATMSQPKTSPTPPTPSTSPAAPAPASPPPAPQPAGAREERVAMTKLRKVIARRLKDAQNTAASLTTFNEADMSAVIALRKEYQERFQERYGVRLGFMGFFVRAAIAALRDIPALNAKIDGDDIVYRDYYNISVAVATDSGLVTPVLREAQEMSLAQIESSIGTLAKRAREGSLQITELQEGTFTITNGGLYGSMLSTPILNMPQSGILGMHSIQQRPVARNGEIVIRPMMYLALSYDHRIVDGREAVTFLVRVKENIEDPRRLLLDI